MSAQYEMSGPLVQVQSSQIWPSIAVEEWALCKGEMSAGVTTDGGLVTGEVAALVLLAKLQTASESQITQSLAIQVTLL